MTPDRWQRIEQLFHDALEQPAPQRAAWLDKVCADDESLRSQVEVLLAANDEASGFLAVPVLAHKSNPPAAPNVSTLRANERITHYRILSKLGAGGMGEVYLAYDEILERQVALKVLPEQFTREPDRLQRFIREGKAASALNHPNIITIHEIGKTPTPTGETHFIVTEFVAGATLRERLRKGKLPYDQALDCAKQITSALAAAHEAGIVHRDIKPENVMVRPDGLVKVLDFGLAKLTEKQQPRVPVDAEADTMMRLSTGQGVVMGTTLYMSPEQARGLNVDARSDLFSLGSVFYELLTGRAPFKGATISDILVGILDREPAPLAQHDSAAPRELQNVISKALRKDRDQRYQSARELLSDLKPLQQRMESQAHWLEEQPTATGLAAATESGKQAEMTAQHDALSSAVIVAELKRHKSGLAATLAVIVLAFVGLFYGMYRWLAARQPANVTMALPTLKPLTAHGRAVVAAISSQGKFVAYATDEGGKQRLWLRQPEALDDTPLTDPAEVEYLYMILAGADDSLYYTVREPHSAVASLYRATTLGKSPKKLMTGVDSAVSFAPDGKRMAFIRSDLKLREWKLMLADADGGNERQLVARRSPAYFNTNLGASPAGVAWSPDGKVIACSAGNATDPRYETVVAYDAETGRELSFKTRQWTQVTFLAWSSADRLIAIAQLLNGRYQLWHIDYSMGATRQITQDVYRYETLALTSDGRAVAVVNDRQAALWMAPAGQPDRATPFKKKTGNDDGYWGLAWQGEDQLLYVVRNPDATAAIHQLKVESGESKKLHSANWIDGLSVAADNRQLAFMQRTEGTEWRITQFDLLTNEPRELVRGGNAYRPSFAPNAQWLVYVANSGEKRLLWKLATDGKPASLSQRQANWPVVSPDGKWIAYNDRETEPNKLGVMPAEGGEPTRLFDYPGIVDSRMADIRWMPDGRALTYIISRNAVSNLWQQSLEGGPPKQLTHFDTQRIYRFDWSRSGKLALSRGEDHNDVMLIEGIQ